MAIEVTDVAGKILAAIKFEHKTPIWELTIDDVPASAELRNRILDISLTDNRGITADEVKISIDNSDNKLKMPKSGVMVNVKMGFKDEGLIDKGVFRVDTRGASGAPDKITIGAKSADLADSWTVKRTKSFENKTLGDIVKYLASNNNLTAKINADLAAIKIKHIDQTNESDINFLTRLTDDYDAVAMIKNNTLIFCKAGMGMTADGKPIPSVTVKKTECVQWDWSQNDADAFTGVRAQYSVVRKGEKKEVLVGIDERTSTLRKLFKTEAAARKAAESELKKLKRGKAKLTFTLGFGRGDIFPETPVVLEGFDFDEITNQDWICVNAVHTLDGNGFQTKIECEFVTDSDDKQQDKPVKSK